LRDRGLTRIAEGLTPELIFKYITWARAPAAGGNSAEINGLHESCGDQATRRASPDALRDFDRQFCNHEPENDDR
jgi:hypothetical protein